MDEGTEVKEHTSSNDLVIFVYCVLDYNISILLGFIKCVSSSIFK